MSKAEDILKACEIHYDNYFEILSAFVDGNGIEHFAEFAEDYKKSHPERIYNKDYGDDLMCVCGHVYHRHFDGYEDNRHVGCKYCECYDFIPAHQ